MMIALKMRGSSKKKSSFVDCWQGLIGSFQLGKLLMKLPNCLETSSSPFSIVKLDADIMHESTKNANVDKGGTFNTLIIRNIP